MKTNLACFGLALSFQGPRMVEHSFSFSWGFAINVSLSWAHACFLSDYILDARSDSWKTGTAEYET